MKLQKQDASGASVDGESYVADDAGVIHVTNADHLAQLQALGWVITDAEGAAVPVSPPPPPAAPAPTREEALHALSDAELLDLLKGANVEVPEGADHDHLVLLALDVPA